MIGRWVNGEIVLGVLYGGIRNWEFGYFKKKWKGVESEDNKNYSKYEGEIKNELPHGQGTLIYSDGRKEVGEFKESTFWLGKNYDENGNFTRYTFQGGGIVGEFKDGLPNGQGTYTSPSGRKYVGEWKDRKN